MSNESSEWISLRHAAEILGVHPATVRNWADEGKLPSRKTAGGHRRFNKNDLLKYAQNESETQPIEVQIIIQNALGQTRMQVGDGQLEQLGWYAKMSETTRKEMRILGRELLEALRRYLAANAPDSGLAEAINIGQRYAVVLNTDSLTLPQAMRGFFYFSDFVINAVLTWSEVTAPRSASEWAEILRHVNTFLSAMQLSIIEYYEAE